MKNIKKRKFWIPAAICVTAFLVAVSMLAPKNITGVFAAEQGETVTVEPLQTQTEGDNADDGDNGNADDDGDNDSGDEASDSILNNIVATFNVNDGDISFRVNNGAEVYYGVGDHITEESLLPVSGDCTVFGENKLVLYSQNAGSITDLTMWGDTSALASANISGLTGLVNLELNWVALPEIDLSQNKNLKSVRLDGNKLKTLDVSKNTKLEILCCADNQLSSINLSNNTTLTHLSVENNRLKKLDVSKCSKLMEITGGNNAFTSFGDVIISSKVSEDFECYIYQPIADAPDSVKAGVKLDLSKYKEYKNKKSYYYMSDCSNEDSLDVNVIPESDENMIFVFGNAYADKEVYIGISNSASPITFYCMVTVEKNPDAADAPKEATGDIPVSDLSGTIKSADAADKFDAQIVDSDESSDTFVLGEKISKEDIRIHIAKDSNTEPYYNTIAKADKTFDKDTARLVVYDINLSYQDRYELIKLTGGINLTLSYPSDIAKDWNKYNYKVYHIAEFDYDKLQVIKGGKVESVEAKADKNGIHITGTSFSPYLISITPKNASTPSPATGESNVATNVAILLALLAITAAVAVFAKFRGEKKAELL